MKRVSEELQRMSAKVRLLEHKVSALEVRAEYQAVLIQIFVAILIDKIPHHFDTVVKINEAQALYLTDLSDLQREDVQRYLAQLRQQLLSSQGEQIP